MICHRGTANHLPVLRDTGRNADRQHRYADYPSVAQAHAGSHGPDRDVCTTQLRAGFRLHGVRTRSPQGLRNLGNRSEPRTDLREAVQYGDQQTPRRRSDPAERRAILHRSAPTALTATRHAFPKKAPTRHALANVFRVTAVEPGGSGLSRVLRVTLVPRLLPAETRPPQDRVTHVTRFRTYRQTCTRTCAHGDEPRSTRHASHASHDLGGGAL